jgi:hypothetical protein
MIRIKAKRDGFRRAGMAHPAEWREYPDDKFDAKQLGALGREPMLQVKVVPDHPVAEKPDPVEASISEADEQPAFDETVPDKPRTGRKGKK